MKIGDKVFYFPESVKDGDDLLPGIPAEVVSVVRKGLVDLAFESHGFTIGAQSVPYFASVQDDGEFCCRCDRVRK
jgi:hypothetical protein